MQKGSPHRGQTFPEVIAPASLFFSSSLSSALRLGRRFLFFIKTASGVQNFIREQGYGAAFNQLYTLVKTRDSCNTEKAVEPSALSVENFESNKEREESDGNCEISDTGGKEEKKQFVPVRGKKRKNKDDTLSEAIQLMRGEIENDPTRDLIQLITEDMEKSHQDEFILMQMLVGGGKPAAIYWSAGPLTFLTTKWLPNHACKL